MTHRLSIDLAGLADQVSRWWLCHRYGHHYDPRHCDPPACIDCGHIRKAPK